MNEKEKKEMINIFNEGFEQVVLPHIQELKDDVSTLKSDVSTLKSDVEEIKEVLEDHGNRLERVERKLDAVVSTQDRQGVEIKKIKTHIN